MHIGQGSTTPRPPVVSEPGTGETGQNGTGERVLVIEDRPDERADILRHVSGAGLTAVICPRADESFDERTDGAKIGLAVVGVVPGCEEAALAIAARLRSAGTPSVLVTTAAGADLDRLLSTRPHGIVCAPFTPEQFRSTLRVALARGNREMLLRRQVERSVQRAEAGEARTAQLEERLRRIADELSPFAGGRAPVPPPLPPRCQALLSRRELEVLRAFTGTGQVDLVARELGLAVATVRNHLKAIYRKMGVHSQSELIEMVHALSATPAASAS